MKYDPLKAFPYPVLRPDNTDYVESDIQLLADLNIEGDSINADIYWALSNDEILAEIDTGNAEYLATISCRDTYFQTTIRSKDNSCTHNFKSTDLRGEVIINSYVVVVNDINNFSSPDINEEFSIEAYSFSTGDVLAQCEPQLFYIDRDMFKPVTSVFDLVLSNDVSDGEWSVSFDEDHVQIEMNAKMKESIDNARNTIENRAILINSVYFAAVMQAIEKVKHYREDYIIYKWAEIIEKQAINIGCDIENQDSCIIAQRLINSPLSLLINYVFKGVDDEH